MSLEQEQILDYLSSMDQQLNIVKELLGEIVGLLGKEKTTTTAKKVDKLVVSFDVENRVARSGPADIYVIVTGPDGKVIPDATGVPLSTRNDGDRPYTYKTTIQYEQGTRKSIQVPMHQDHFQTGDYKIEIYQNGFKIAEGVRSLKKGGLFG